MLRPTMQIRSIGTSRDLHAEIATADAPKSSRQELLNSSLSAGLILATFAGLTAWSWRKWPDLVVDFGLQLYAPWQLASGSVLYRDLNYLAGGPFSQYLHALLFRAFGVSLTVLVIFNLFLLLLFVGLLYRLFLSAADRWTATAVCLVTLSVFSFSQYVGIGNYNYVCPYTYEAFHGLVLSVAAIACLSRWVQTRRYSWAFAAGIGFGAVFMTKPDVYLALLFCGTGAVLVCWIIPVYGFHARGKGLAFLVAGHAVPIAIFTTYYGLVWSFRGGLRAVAAAWLPVLTTRSTQNAYYKWCLGLDRPWQNLTLIVEYFAGFCLIAAFLAVCSRYLRRRNVGASVLLAGLLLALAYAAIYRFPWSNSGKALAPLTLLGCGAIAWKCWRVRHSPDALKLVFPLLWSVFALALLAKLGLNTRLWHYGFYLAMPAAVFVVFCLIGWVPPELPRFGIRPTVFRVLVAVFLTIGVCQLLRVSQYFYKFKDFSIGSRADRIITYSPAVMHMTEGVHRTVNWLQEHTDPSATLATLPQGVMINYLARRPNPTPFAVLALPELRAYDEAQILAAYVHARPDYIVLLHRDDSEYGVKYFGQEPGFGFAIMRWIRANYTPLWRYGAEPLQTDQFGIRILVRKDRQPEGSRDVEPPTD